MFCSTGTGFAFQQTALIGLDLIKAPRNRCFIRRVVYPLDLLRHQRKYLFPRPVATTTPAGYANRGTFGETLIVSDTVELKNGDFLRIKELRMGGSIVRGWRFCSTNKIHGLPANLPNEVCWILHMKEGDFRDPKSQCMEEISRSECGQKRRLILVNLDGFTSSEAESSLSASKSIRGERTLICRWKYICYVKSNKERRPLADVQCYSTANESSAIIRLREEECDEGPLCRSNHSNIRTHWRGPNIAQAGFIGTSRPIVEGDDEVSRLGFDRLALNPGEQTSSPPGDLLLDSKKRDNIYTFGDAFCGAGGASRGAALAGLQIRWGFDSDINAYEAYKANFSQAARLTSAVDFVKNCDVGQRVDVLHLSPPCQAFSKANTTPNAAKDQLNIAASMTIGGVLALTKPRFVTLEQADGIIWYKKHQQYFSAILRQFTSLGFSVCWRILRFAEYGLPQQRVWLIIIASG